jgi:uncharacterized membrane protein HdeD (DUF308 family)
MAPTTPSTRLAVSANRWKWFLACGAILLVLGLAGVSVSSFMETASLMVFGPMLVAAGVIQLFVAFLAEERKEAVLHFMASGLEAALGFWIMAHPLERVVDLVLVIAIFFLITGVIRLGRSLSTTAADRGWTAMAGVVALVMGTCVWLRWPDARWWFVGLCIAIDFLFHGMSWTALALSEKRTTELRREP